MRLFASAVITAALLGLGCTAPAPEHEMGSGGAAADEANAVEAQEALTTPRDAIDCGFNHDRTCKSKGPLANGLTAQTQWDPCYGGEFTWTAVLDLELGYDFLCVDGHANALGCTQGQKLTGNATFTGHSTGLIPVEMITDYSVQSNGIVSLTAVCDEPLFTGIWAPSATAASQQFFPALNWTQLTSKISTLASQNMRLSSVDLWYPDPNSGYAYFDAIFDAGTGGYGLNAGITIAQLKSLATSNAAQGLILSDVDAQQTASGVVYIAVFKAGTASQQIYDGATSGFLAWATPYLNADYKVTTFESYQIADGTTYGAPRLTAVVSRAGAYKNTSGEWALVTGVEYPAFATAWKANQLAGRTLARVESHIVNGARLYDGVFQTSAGATDFAPSTRSQQFLDEIASNRTSGWALVDLDRVKTGYRSYAPMEEEVPIANEYPATPPEWTAEAEAYMHPVGKPVAGGYTLALSRDGELLGATSAGNNGNGTKLTPEAHWDYLSDSKTLTGLAALRLAELKGYDIHTTTILPLIASRLDSAKIGLPTAGPDLWDITIWQALTHNSKLVSEGCNEPGSEKDIIVAANIDPNAGTVYSGGNPCLLRLLIEQTSGMGFEDFVRKYVTTPVGIHDMDCQKDPEHVEVYDYPIPNGSPGAPGVPFSIINNQCSAGGFKGTAMALLNILNGTRNPGMLSSASLTEYRAAAMTFYPGQELGIWRSAMAGGVADMTTVMVQFPADPVNNTDAALKTTGVWTHGVQAVLFVNFDTPTILAPLVPAMKADPQ